MINKQNSKFYQVLLVTEGVTKLLASLCIVDAAKCESAFHLLVQNKAYFLCSSQSEIVKPINMLDV